MLVVKNAMKYSIHIIPVYDASYEGKKIGHFGYTMTDTWGKHL